jgi:hypothetical protein
MAAELGPKRIRNDCQFRCAKLPSGGLPTARFKIFLIFQKHNSGLKREFSPPVGSLIDFHDVVDTSGL